MTWPARSCDGVTLWSEFCWMLMKNVVPNCHFLKGPLNRHLVASVTERKREEGRAEKKILKKWIHKK